MALTKDQNAQLLADVARIADAVQELARVLGPRQAPGSLPDEPEADPTPEPQVEQEAPETEPQGSDDAVSPEALVSLNQWLVEAADWMTTQGTDGRRVVYDALKEAGCKSINDVKDNAAYQTLVSAVDRTMRSLGAA